MRSRRNFNTSFLSEELLFLDISDVVLRLTQLGLISKLHLCYELKLGSVRMAQLTIAPDQCRLMTDRLRLYQQQLIARIQPIKMHRTESSTPFNPALRHLYAICDNLPISPSISIRTWQAAGWPRVCSCQELPGRPKNVSVLHVVSRLTRGRIAYKSG